MACLDIASQWQSPHFPEGESHSLAANSLFHCWLVSSPQSIVFPPPSQSSLQKQLSRVCGLMSMPSRAQVLPVYCPLSERCLMASRWPAMASADQAGGDALGMRRGIELPCGS